MQATHLHTSSLSQMIIYKLLNYWGENIYKKHLNYVCYYYWKKRDIMEDALNKYLINKNCIWDIPTAGMFYWINIINIKDTQDLIYKKAKDNKILLLPGKSFFIDERKDNCSFVRAAFSVATNEQIYKGIKRFSELL